MRIDLQNDPEIPAGRELIENLVAAHMVAGDEEELLHMVGISINEVYSSTPEKSLRIMTHAAYRAQALIVRLLDLSTRQALALNKAGIRTEVDAGAEGELYRAERLDLWSRLRDEHL